MRLGWLNIWNRPYLMYPHTTWAMRIPQKGSRIINCLRGDFEIKKVKYRNSEKYMPVVIVSPIKRKI
jgi:hypothetical protein